MKPTGIKLVLPDLKTFDQIDRRRRTRRLPRLRSSMRYNPMGKSTTEQKCRDAFASLAPRNLSTQRKYNYIPFEKSREFAEIVLDIKNDKNTVPIEVYRLLIVPVLDKISTDNIHDLQEKLAKKNIYENDKREYSSKIEFFEAKDYKVFTALFGLMNAQGWKVDKNGQQLRPHADHKELAALDYLNNIRKTFS